jgi:MOSC domain-containing protein YiiM
MEGDDGVSRSVQVRKKAIEIQWLARVLETGQVREDAALSFSMQRESGSLR